MLRLFCLSIFLCSLKFGVKRCDLFIAIRDITTQCFKRFDVGLKLLNLVVTLFKRFAISCFKLADAFIQPVNFKLAFV